MKLQNLPIVLGFSILLITLPASVFLVSQRRQTTTVTAKPTATALVYIWPRKFNLTRNETATLEIKVDTKGQPARRAEVLITFNPQSIHIDSEITPSPGVSLAQKVLNKSRGTLQLSGVGDFKTGKSLAKFTVTGVKEGTTTIKIVEAHVWDPSGTTDILGSTADAQITIK